MLLTSLKHSYIKTKEELLSFLNATKDVVSLKVYSTSPNAEVASVYGLSIGVSKTEAAYIPIFSKTTCFGVAGLRAILAFLHKKKKVILYDLRNQLRILEKVSERSLESLPVWDAQIDFWLCDTNAKQPSLEDAQLQVCGLKRGEINNLLSGTGHFEEISPEDLEFDACIDAASILEIEQICFEQLKKLNVNPSIDQNVLYPLMKCENNIIHIQKDFILQIEQKSKLKIKECLADIYSQTGVRLNYESDFAIRRFLNGFSFTFEKLSNGLIDSSLHSLEKALSSPAWNNNQEKRLLSDFITIKKLDTFLKQTIYGIKEMMASTPFDGGRFCYKNCNVPTGRLSSGKTENPFFCKFNIQSIVKPETEDWFARKATEDEIRQGLDICGWRFLHSKDNDYSTFYIVSGKSMTRNIRQCFIPDKDSLWLTVDMDSQELRIISNLYKEQEWINAFLAGKDIHQENAIKIFGKQNYSSKTRKLVKEFTYGMNYGMSDNTFKGRHPEIPADVLDTFIKSFKRNISAILSGQKQEKEIALTTGFCHAGFSRKRKISELLKTNEGRASANGIIKNSPVQGIAGDVLKIQLRKLWNNVFSKKEFEGVRFMHTIHDEINFSVPRNIFNQAVHSITSCMSFQKEGWPVPLTCGIEIGLDWGTTFKFYFNEEKQCFEPIIKKIA